MSKITNDDLTGLAQDVLYLYPCGNSGGQRVKLCYRIVSYRITEYGQ